MLNNAIKKKMKQITNNIMMIKPVEFRYNEQTAVNNYYYLDCAINEDDIIKFSDGSLIIEDEI